MPNPAEAKSIRSTSRQPDNQHHPTPNNAVNNIVKHGVPMKSKKREPIRLSQIIHLGHRFAIFLCALYYIGLSFSATYSSVGLLRGKDNPSLTVETDSFDLMGEYVGTTTIRESRLVKTALSDSTAPVNGTLFLKSASESSFTQCSEIPEIQRAIYDDHFLRSLYGAIADGTSYHITELAPTTLELIAPVVDCSTSDIVQGDSTSGKFFFLVRERANHDNVSVVTVSMSNQQYRIAAQGENGPAGVTTVQLVNDMRATDLDFHFAISLGYPFEKFSFRVYDYVNTTMDGQWTLQSVPASFDEIPKVLLTACRSGFYIKAESEQSNINNVLWTTDKDARNAITRWKWVSTPVLHDSWAWVHGVQFFIGMGILSNHAILCIATYRNFLAGKLWIGDAFLSISESQIFNGVAVIISWFMNEYWSLHEFCFHSGNILADLVEIHVYEAHMHADMLTIFLSACGLIGTLLRERIDPLMAMFCFEVGFQGRKALMGLIPGVRSAIVEYAMYANDKSVSAAVDGQEAISPMLFFTTHPIGKRSYSFVFNCILPIFSTLILILIYAVARKIHHHYHPEPLHTQRGNTGTGTRYSGGEEASSAPKRVLTLFEIATGAELENRFGLVSDYETCLFIKGMKFASADGIYSNGFVIANKKFLLQTRDYWSILFMKILRKRYKNIYVFEVNGSTVQQTARLVYPHTMSLADLSNLNISVLS